MKKAPPAFLKAKAEERPALPDATVKDIADAIAKARDLKKEIEDLEEIVAKKSGDLDKMLRVDIPDALEKAGTKSFTLAASGNLPEIEVKIEAFYAASISSKWEESKRKDAFTYLESLDAGSLIKTVVSVPFGREERKDVEEFLTLVHEQGFEPEVEEAVHASTLKSWLKERTEKLGLTTDLDKIGGMIGRIAKLKEKNS